MTQLSRVVQTLVLGIALLGLGACTSTQVNTSASPRVDRQAAWSVLPLVNNTSTPYAGARAQRQLGALLGAQGLKRVLIAPDATGSGPLPIANGEKLQKQSLEWANSHDARYALTGSVDEWRYKIGLDGQPAVGFTLHLVDLKTGAAIWSGASSASGNSREGLAVLSQRVLARLIEQMLP